MTKRFTLFFSFFLLTFGLNAQTMRQLKKAVNEALAQQEYHKALQFLDIIQEIDSTDMDMQYKQAEAARLFNAFILAEKRYNQILESDVATTYPETKFWLATVQKSQGNYDAAITNFKEYIASNPDTTNTLVTEAKAQLKACNWAKELIQYKDEDLTIHQLGQEVNSVHSDFAPLKYEDKLIYSSLRFEAKNQKGITPKKYTKILTLKDGDNTSELFDLGYNEQDIHTAHLAFNSTEDRLFFNICQYTAGSIIQCKIYYKDKIGDTWGESIPLPEYINAPKKTTTQPNLGYIEALGKEVLFFASDRMGGKGGLDIWYSVLDKNGLPEAPQNLQEINTKKDDITPFFHEYSQYLYFSSEGWESLGGHDIYKSRLIEQDWSVPDHTGYPLNTSYNDIYFSLNKNGSVGYFASNREGTALLEKEISACCNDIFRADFNSFFIDLKVLTFQEINGQKSELTAVNVTVFELFDNVEKEILHKIKPEGNQHLYRIKSNKNYRIEVKKDGFIPKTLSFNTDDALADVEIVKEVVLLKPNLQVLTFNGNFNTPLNQVTVSLNGIDKDGNILETIPLKKSEDNRYYFPLEYGKNYQIIANKNGYQEATEIFNTANLSDANKNLIKRLILQPTKEEESKIVLRTLKPFPLYFDNDYPNPRSRDTVTNATFPMTLKEYKRKKEQFKTGYSKGLKGEKKIMAEYEVEKFFEIEMEETYKEFIKFTEAVLNRLEFGREVVISVSAYTSPLASEDYNMRLSKRRISSMLNFYRAYKNGAMKQYVDDGKLTIKLIPLGESAAPTDISDNPDDRQHSVYSIEASMQRKVEIREVETQKSNTSNTAIEN